MYNTFATYKSHRNSVGGRHAQLYVVINYLIALNEQHTYTKRAALQHNFTITNNTTDRSYKDTKRTVSNTHALHQVMHAQPK